MILKSATMPEKFNFLISLTLGSLPHVQLMRVIRTSPFKNGDTHSLDTQEKFWARTSSLGFVILSLN